MSKVKQGEQDGIQPDAFEASKGVDKVLVLNKQELVI